MGISIKISEGGEARQFLADKLRTDLATASGSTTTQDWYPKDDIALLDKTITKNGEYDPKAEDSRPYGYGVVTVEVAPNLAEKTVTENGTYLAADDGADGYRKVTVKCLGSDILTGVNPPSASLGSDGQLYIQLDAGEYEAPLETPGAVSERGYEYIAYLETHEAGPYIDLGDLGFSAGYMTLNGNTFGDWYQIMFYGKFLQPPSNDMGISGFESGGVGLSIKTADDQVSFWVEDEGHLAPIGSSGDYHWRDDSGKSCGLLPPTSTEQESFFEMENRVTGWATDPVPGKTHRYLFAVNGQSGLEGASYFRIGKHGYSELWERVTGASWDSEEGEYDVSRERHFWRHIPARRKSDGALGVFKYSYVLRNNLDGTNETINDYANGAFLTNQGAGTFYGPSDNAGDPIAAYYKKNGSWRLIYPDMTAAEGEYF